MPPAEISDQRHREGDGAVGLQEGHSPTQHTIRKEAAQSQLGTVIQVGREHGEDTVSHVGRQSHSYALCEPGRPLSHSDLSSLTNRRGSALDNFISKVPTNFNILFLCFNFNVL